MDAHILAASILKNITNQKIGKQPIGPRNRRSRAADLIFAVQQKDCPTLERILKEGADPNSSILGSTPLAVAVWEGLVDCIATLLRLGANPNLHAVDHLGRMEPPLVSAIRLGHPCSISILLLENGADPNIKDFYGHTALWAAVYARRGDLVQLVLRYGARVREWKDGKEVMPLWNECPLYQAVLQGRQLWRFLVHAGASVEAVGKNGLTPLHLAVKKGDTNVVKGLILGLGARVYPPEGMKRDKWLSTNVLEELKEWLLEEMNAPPPLIRLCRHRIRLRISEINGGLSVHNSLNKLPLPDRMKKYLMLDPLEP